MATAKKTAPKKTTTRAAAKKTAAPKASTKTTRTAAKTTKSQAAKATKAAKTTSTKTADGTNRLSLGPIELNNVDVKALVADYAYATVGATDRALVVARELPQKLEELSKIRAEKAQELLKTNSEKAEARLTEVRTKVQEILKDPARLQDEVKDSVQSARKEYDAYAARGRQVVKSVADADATKKALEQTENARSQIKGAVTSIRKAVEQGQDAVEDAAGRIGIRRTAA